MHKLTSISAEPTSTPPSVSGAGMDRKISVKKPLWKKPILFLIGAALIISALFLFDRTAERTLSVEGNRLTVSEVFEGTFEDFIPIRGRVMPSRTLFLDAVEGGRVERILVEDGAMLSEGDLIVELSNTSLQLSVLENEARVAEQLNTIRTIELNLEQNRLQHKRNLVDIEYQIKLLTRKLAQEQTLLAQNSISKTQYDDTQDTLTWYKQRLQLTKESQASDSRMQEAQLAFLRETGSRLEHNLSISQQTLDNMNLRAPISGKLSGFDIEVGQSIGRGERIGQIDIPDDFKVTVLVDEFYLNRVDIGQVAQYDDFELVISKIYPQVQNGQFEVDLTFIGEQPQTIRRGQSLQMKLTLGDASSATLIPNGSFYQDTGGNWVFVVSDDGSQANKRTVRLGRRNNTVIEVIEGLEPGERVVTSAYSNYLDMQVLRLQ
ncbi:efflux RND transporter periplasmic adaptor subunit [Alteromonas sediminis]|uniref:Efflux RND transporter periplasmic adaptor subunit n=1 Tax=Alteromonas sediminis TaxID=2259342 RepID=A0A3N5XYA5_9ALTE|nr:efflux RND transporter periplasmic adaptor subunit [Alteromonas sediminis]RPJ65922.1 efflux RND transporter periplasmic adaptor subunit [Alteromonas sediminis]